MVVTDAYATADAYRGVISKTDTSDLADVRPCFSPTRFIHGAPRYAVLPCQCRCARTAGPNRFDDLICQPAVAPQFATSAVGPSFQPHVLPISTAPDGGDSDARDSVPPCKNIVAINTHQNRPNVCLQQFRESVAFAVRVDSHLRGVVSVLDHRSVFQIVCAIVCLVAINVIDFITDRALPKKSGGDQRMNIDPPLGLDSATEQSYLHPARASVGQRFQYVPNRSPLRCSFTPYSPQVGYGVPAFIANDRTPLLRFLRHCPRLRPHDRHSSSVPEICIERGVLLCQ